MRNYPGVSRRFEKKLLLLSRIRPACGPMTRGVVTREQFTPPPPEHLSIFLPNNNLQAYMSCTSHLLLINIYYTNKNNQLFNVVAIYG